MVDATERLQVLLTQEANIYRTSDYLTRMQQVFDLVSTSCDKSTAPSPKKRKSLSGDYDGSDSSPTEQSTNASSANGETEGSSSSQINKHWREKICEWAYQVVDHFDLNREVVSIAMSHLDRYLVSYPTEVDKNLFQLLAMTCLYLSIKLNEYKHLLIPGSKSSMDTILQLSRGFFTLDQMEKMEQNVLQRLQWHVHPPTPQVFVKHFLFFLSFEEHEVHDLAQFMVELSVMDYFFVSFKASEVAVAALLNAMERLFPHAPPQWSIAFQSSYLDIYSPEVQACRERLALIYNQANDQSPSYVGNHSYAKSSDHSQRTTSPVSVMAAPQPSPAHSQNTDEMEAEYSDDEEL